MEGSKSESGRRKMQKSYGRRRRERGRTKEGNGVTRKREGERGKKKEGKGMGKL